MSALVLSFVDLLFPTVGNNNMADVRACKLQTSLEPLSVELESNV